MTVTVDARNDGTLTLTHRLADGPLPLADTLRFGLLLAENIRQTHDSGATCGALQPSNIAVTPSGLDVLVTPREHGTITPYTAPEILHGQAADARSDIFAFGAILYEMATGRRAFAGETADALAVSLTISVPNAVGIAGLDHVIANCIAKDPSLRSPRMQKVILELKLLTVVPRAETVARQQTVKAMLHTQSEKLENSVAAVLEKQEKAISHVQQASDDAITELRDRLSRLEAALPAAQSQSEKVDALCQEVVRHLEKLQKNDQSLGDRLSGLSKELDTLSQEASVMREYVGARMDEFEQTLNSQRNSLVSVAASQGQTDDVVEGLVGAMELVNTIVFDKEEAFR